MKRLFQLHLIALQLGHPSYFEKAQHPSYSPLIRGELRGCCNNSPLERGAGVCCHVNMDKILSL
jgi:hypothetical protein